MNFAWTVLKSRQSTLGLRGICSVESTEFYLPHRLFLLQNKLKETETNRNCSKKMSWELQSLHNLFLQLKKNHPHNNRVHGGNCFPDYHILYVSVTSAVILCWCTDVHICKGNGKFLIRIHLLPDSVWEYTSDCQQSVKWNYATCKVNVRKDHLGDITNHVKYTQQH